MLIGLTFTLIVLTFYRDELVKLLFPMTLLPGPEEAWWFRERGKVDFYKPSLSEVKVESGYQAKGYLFKVFKKEELSGFIVCIDCETRFAHGGGIYLFRGAYSYQNITGLDPAEKIADLGSRKFLDLSSIPGSQFTIVFYVYGAIYGAELLLRRFWIEDLEGNIVYDEDFLGEITWLAQGTSDDVAFIRTASTYTATHKIIAKVEAERIQYYGRQVKATIKVVDENGNSVDPTTLTVKAVQHDVELDLTVIKVASGVYQVTIHNLAYESYDVVVTATPTKFGYETVEGSATISIMPLKIVVTHNIPSALEKGTYEFTVETSDPVTGKIDVDKLTVTVVDPYNRRSDVTVTRMTKGTYVFTLAMNVEGAYYITITACRSGYVSAHEEITVDIVAKHVWWEWIRAILLSPTIIIGAGITITLFIIRAIITRRKR